MTRYYLLFLLILQNLTGWCQPPADNPYRSRYLALKETHWTDSLKWNNITVASNVKGLVNDLQEVDSLILHNTIHTISEKGGGVLFFNSGNYYLPFNLILEKGVILRGESPGVKDAKRHDYTLKTKFIFPKYYPKFEGKGTPNSTAFKLIYNRDAERNALVNIDINRARAYFRGEKVLLFGVRSNNTADPKTVFYADYKNQGWQRYPYIATGNFHITSRNCIIANCRVNDAITDDFAMPNFLANDGVVFKGDIVKFQYGFQYGIKLDDFSSGPVPQIELLDNYIKSYLADKVVNSFHGKLKNERNNFQKLDCQNFIDSLNFYTNTLQEKTHKMFKPAVYINGTDTLRYSIQLPPNYDPNKKYPFVLYFHGIGQHGYDKDHLVHCTYVFSNKNILSQNPYIVVAPHIKENERFSAPLDSLPTKPMQNTLDLVEQLSKKYSIDSSRKFVMGWSSGGGAAWETIARQPKQFNYAVIMAAIRPIPKKTAVEMKHISITLTAGTNDKLPIKEFRDAVQSLKEAGFSKVHYFEYEGVKHSSQYPLLADPAFQQFLINYEYPK